MKQISKWLVVILIIVGMSTLMMLHKNRNDSESIENLPQNISTSEKTITIEGKIVDIYSLYGYTLRIEVSEDEKTVLYEVPVPESDKSTIFETGDDVIVTVSSDGFINECSPPIITGIISIKIK